MLLVPKVTLFLKVGRRTAVWRYCRAAAAALRRRDAAAEASRLETSFTRK